MANPQPDKFIRISTELWEAWASIRIPGVAEQCLKVIIRKTYGWNKKSDQISLSQFALSLKTTPPNTARALRLLNKMNLIVIKDNENGKIYSINKNYSTWKPLSKKSTLTHRRVPSVVKEDNRLYSKKSNTIDTLTIDTNKDIERTKPFKPPTLKEVSEYTLAQNIQIDHHRFIDFYTSKGWMIGKNKMKDWKAAVRGWARNNKTKSSTDNWLEKRKEVIDAPNNPTGFLPSL